MNYTKSTYRNQAQSKIKINFRDIDPQQNPFDYFHNCPLAGQLVYGAILKLSNHFENIHVKQQTIADMAGVHINSAKKYINIFHRDKALWMVGRHKTSSLYKIPHFIIQSAPKLKHIFLALSFFSIGLLFPAKKNYQTELSALDKPSYFFKNNVSVNHNVNVNVYTDNLRTVKRSKVVMSNSNSTLEAGVAVNTGTVFDPKRISESLNAVKNVNFTLEQLIDLSAYPKNAHQTADIAIGSSKKTVSEPFKYFAKICETWCKNNNVKPNYRQRDFWKQTISSYETVLPVEKKTIEETVNQSNSKTSSDNTTQLHKPKSQPKQLYPSALMESYLNQFRSVSGYRDNDAMIGKKGWDHKLAYAAAREAWWKEKEFNKTPENELERWENCLTPEIEAVLDKADQGSMAGSKDFLLKMRDNAINELRKQANLPEPAKKTYNAELFEGFKPLNVVLSQALVDGFQDREKHECRDGCGCDGWVWEEETIVETFQ